MSRCPVCKYDAPCAGCNQFGRELELLREIVKLAAAAHDMLEPLLASGVIRGQGTASIIKRLGIALNKEKP